MSKIIINETFGDEDEFSLEETLEDKNIVSQEFLDLTLEADEISNETEIKNLISYPKIKKNLTYNLPHQSEGALKILRDMNCTALLADEVGLGKTITTGITIKESIERGITKKILILTPPSLVDQWVEEMREKFELDFKIVENENDWEKSDLMIASIDRVKVYDKIKRRFKHQKAHEISWDLLIVDEGHKLKDRNTVRWKFVDQMKKKRFLILTATPFQNDLLELYNLLHILKRGHLGTMKEFRDRFIHKGNKRHPLNPKDLKRKLDEIMIRRKRDETTIKYTKRIPKVISIELTKEEKDIYDRITDLLKTKYFSVTGSEINGRLIIFSILPKITSSSRSAIESLTKISNNGKYHEKTRKIAYEILNDYKKIKKDSKIEKLIETIKLIYKKDKDSKILIYTKHPSTLKYIVEKLEPFKLNIVEFAGGLTREEKTLKIKSFKEGADIMISTETGAEGLNFQFCSNLINYDLPWNPMSVEQRIGRLDRIGQKNNMNLYSLATKDTMEEHIVDLIINKMCCIGLVIGELPIILFNLGLDGRGEKGKQKIEEMLMDAFIDSKNNLSSFKEEISRISKIINSGVIAYKKAKNNTSEILDTK